MNNIKIDSKNLMRHTTHGVLTDLENSERLFSHVKDKFKQDEDFRDSWRADYYSSPEITTLKNDEEFDKARGILMKDSDLLDTADSGDSSGYYRELEFTHIIGNNEKFGFLIIAWFIVVTILSNMFVRAMMPTDESLESFGGWQYSESKPADLYYDDISFSDNPGLLDEVNKIQSKIDASKDQGIPSLGLIITSDDKITGLNNKTLLKLESLVAYSDINDVAVLVYNVNTGEKFVYTDKYNRDTFGIFDSVIGNISNSDTDRAVRISEDEFIVLNNWASTNIYKDTLSESFDSLLDYMSSTFNKEKANEYAESVRKSQTYGAIVVGILGALVIGSLGIGLGPAVIWVGSFPGWIKKRAYKQAYQYNKIYESVMQYRLIRDGVINTDRFVEKKEEKPVVNLSKGDDNVDDKEGEDAYDLVKSLQKIKISVWSLKVQGETSSEITGEIHKVAEMIDDISNEISDTSIQNKVEWFIRRYGKLIIESINAVNDIDDVDKRSKKTAELIGYISKSIEKLHNASSSNKESKADISIETLGNLMRLDGQI